MSPSDLRKLAAILLVEADNRQPNYQEAAVLLRSLSGVAARMAKDETVKLPTYEEAEASIRPTPIEIIVLEETPADPQAESAFRERLVSALNYAVVGGSLFKA
jgi:hypothetical protein